MCAPVTAAPAAVAITGQESTPRTRPALIHKDMLRRASQHVSSLLDKIRLAASGFCERLLQIGDDIVGIFNADGKANHVRPGACSHFLLVTQLTVRR
ncbi:Uncharacterised protein [Brucella abortus]|nr:Uncharacterised protein [Brucella abortus]